MYGTLNEKCFSLVQKIVSYAYFCRCGLRQQICVPLKCPPFEEVNCDPECEKPEFVRGKCGCGSMKCVPLKNDEVIPECGKCETLKKKVVEKCGVEKYECAPKRVSLHFF